MSGSFGEQRGEPARGVVHGEASLRHAPKSGEDFPVGGALVSEDAAVVDVGEAGDVPGMGGMAGAALSGVAGEAFQGRGPEEVDLRPRAGRSRT
jgi:hypothetical protein